MSSISSIVVSPIVSILDSIFSEMFTNDLTARMRYTSKIAANIPRIIKPIDEMKKNISECIETV
jgi:hypothetical protein